MASICLGQVFSGLWWRISRILDFTYLDAVMFARVAHTLFQYSKGSENRWVHLNLAYICLGPAFSGLWWRISWILNFTCLDAILFTKVAHTLFQHISEKRKPLSLLQSGLWFPRTSIFWTWWRISLILDFTCLDAIMFAKVAQTLFQHFLGKWKTFGLLKSETSLPRISDL